MASPLAGVHRVALLFFGRYHHRAVLRRRIQPFYDPRLEAIAHLHAWRVIANPPIHPLDPQIVGFIQVAVG